MNRVTTLKIVSLLASQGGRGTFWAGLGLAMKGTPGPVCLVILFNSQMFLPAFRMHSNGSQSEAAASASGREQPEKPTLAPCLRRPRRTLLVGACAHQIPPLDVSRQHSRSGRAARPFPAALPELPRPLPGSRERSPGSDPTRARSPH